MCKYCDNDEITPLTKWLFAGSIGLAIIKNNLVVSYDDYFLNWETVKENIKINYCPFCGRKLK